MSDPTREPQEKRPALPPVAYPILGLVFGGILVFSFSRVLLAVTKATAPAIGLLMALNILVGASMVAYGGRVVHFDIDPEIKRRLLNGLDDIGITLAEVAKIDAYEKSRAWPAPATTSL